LDKKLEHRFVKLLEANQNIVHKICRLYTNDKDAHDDLFQEITIQLWRAFPKAITLYRKSKRQIDTQDFESLSFKIKSEEYDDTTEQQLKLMYDAVKKLNDIDKALVFLYLEDKSYREISGTLGISEVNARVKINRAKDKLRKILNP